MIVQTHFQSHAVVFDLKHHVDNNSNSIGCMCAVTET